MPLPIPDYVPEGGWNEDEFRGSRGRRLLRDWVQTRRRIEKVVVKSLMEDLRVSFKHLEDGIAGDMMNHYNRVRKSGPWDWLFKELIEVEGDQRVWAGVLKKHLAKFDIEVSYRATNTYKKAAATGYEAVSVQLGHTPTKKEIDDATKDGVRLAQKVTRISETTRDRLERELLKAAEDALTIPETVKRIRERFPQIGYNRIATIARTEMGRLMDHSTIKALKQSNTVLEVSVIGCEAVEPGIPTYKGVPTCNIKGVPVADVDKLEFHINHTGAIIASKFINKAPVDKPRKPPAKPTPPPPPVEDIVGATTAPVDNAAFPSSLAGVEVVRKLGGTTGALLVKDKATGALFVRKSGASPAHLREEMLTDKIYRDQGLDVPEFKEYADENGNPVKLARFVDGELLSDLTGKRRDDAIKKLREDFALDSFLGNWDVAGTGLDNVLVDKAGKVWRIDNGGGLRFRAMGDLKKPGEWTPFTEELWTMREPPNVGAKVFGGMEWKDIETSIKKIDFQKVLDSIPDAEKEMKELVAGKALEYRRTARFAQRYRVADYVSDYQNRTLRFGMKMRRHGLSGGVSDEIVPDGTGATVFFKDKQGRAFGGWRGKGASTSAPSVATQAVGDIYDHAKAAVVTLKHHAAKGAVQGANMSTIDSFIAAYDNAPIGVKVHHKDTYEAVTKMKKALAKQDLLDAEGVYQSFVKDLQVDPFPYYAPPAPAAAPATTPFSAYAAAADEYFGYSSGSAAEAVRLWQSSQAGSSWGDYAMAHSYFQLEKATNLGLKSAYLRGSWADTDRLQDAYKDFLKMSGLTEDQLTDAFAFHHQYVQEMLEHADFRGNDWERGVIHLARTMPKEELAGATLSSPSAVGVAGKGTNRGPNVSMSVAQTTIISNRHVTSAAVPHARVTGAYWAAPSWKHEGKDSFAGDFENEFGVLAPGIDFQYYGEGQTAEAILNAKLPTTGKDATKWGVPLGHLKKSIIAWLQKLQRSCGCL